MADGDSCIGGFQEVADRASNYVAASKDHCLLACGINSANTEELHDTLWCTGYKQGVTAPFCQFTNVDSTKTIDILFIGYG